VPVPKIELLRRPAVGDRPVEWVARLGTTVFRILSYEVNAGTDGTAVVLLEVPAGDVRIGEQEPGPAGGAHMPAADRVLQPWGAPGPDPRASIPGWEPPQDGLVQP
jgi:hypothetical protein